MCVKRQVEAVEYQSVFNRRELKYKITKEQKEIILKAIEPYMQLDQYGKTTIRNIYLIQKIIDL